MPKADVPVETSIQQLHGQDWLACYDAARLLGQSRDPRAVEALLQSLKDRTMTVHQRAIVALGRIRAASSP